MRAEPQRLAAGGCAFERQRGVRLERRHGRLEEELIDARADQRSEAE
jgi:hypothetical protein